MEVSCAHIPHFTWDDDEEAEELIPKEGTFFSNNEADIPWRLEKGS